MFGRYFKLCVSLYQTKQLNIKIMKFTKQREYDKGFGFINTYVCGNWSIVNIESGWMVSYNGKQITITDTLKEGKASVCGMVAFNEELI